MSDGATRADAPTLTVRRRIAATPEKVFDAWTNAKGMEKWMCPGPTERADVELDVRVGGRFRIDMHGAGQVHEHTGEYLELERPKRLVFTWVSKSTGGRDSRVTVELEPADGGTDVVLTHEGLPSEESAQNHEMGWASILEKLDGRVS